MNKLPQSAIAFKYYYLTFVNGVGGMLGGLWFERENYFQVVAG
ncbi:hypothetical protein HMPREF9104_02116 [Lentilactobacillus kisonensis F0435]|uniref:Uncharacterized protein n=1 Tax=Lentilactobacillus kisonensis F0435 TaxID=797516 RepID=H1LHM5_9LACO|nr:hypothetical protein HMPREF9104_02116 [Lentilactobacillus kisonensis F0435]